MTNTSEFMVTRNVEQVKEQLNKIMAERIISACNQLQREMKQTVSGSHNGVKYKIPRSSRTYIASKPGETFASRTGELQDSIKYGLHITDTEVVGTIGSQLKRAVYVENGTSTVEARPFFLKTFEKERGELKRTLGGEQ
ncbi:TPA: HK97 gp10 family phage protein [Bacillus toyonensis]|nr:HK97 gp10 family phage protein [Bacillus toyonensis]